jgi:signal transduction histidine kinase
VRYWSPCNAVLGFSELLSMGELGAEEREWTGLILKAGRHLLNDVLEISRIEGGNLCPCPWSRYRSQRWSPTCWTWSAP